ncbi:MAG: serine/threonine-protein kinase [Myxococcota bacterium]
MERLLAEGGMASVYLARRHGPGGFLRHAAVKVIRPELTRDPDVEVMFLDEARVAARIRHPNVIRTESLGEVGGQLYIAMEYVPGVPLSTLLGELNRRGLRPSTPMALALALRIAGGLHAAHETHGVDGARLNIVHRDMSPQNVLLGVNGALKVIDFGVASARDRLYRTGHGGVRGKLRYMPPEQLLGADVDRRADLYSLGVMLWEMLTMKRMFRGRDDAEVIRLVVAGMLPSASLHVSLPSPLTMLLGQLLALDPASRPRTGRSIIAAIRAICSEALMIQDEDISALLWGLLPTTLDELPESANTNFFDTREMTTLPHTAVERFTVPMEPTKRVESRKRVEPPPLAEPLEDTTTCFDRTLVDAPAIHPPTFTAPPPREGLPLVALLLVVIALGGALGAGAFAALGRTPPAQTFQTQLGPS